MLYILRNIYLRHCINAQQNSLSSLDVVELFVYIVFELKLLIKYNSNLSKCLLLLRCVNTNKHLGILEGLLFLLNDWMNEWIIKWKWGKNIELLFSWEATIYSVISIDGNGIFVCKKEGNDLIEASI